LQKPDCFIVGRMRCSIFQLFHGSGSYGRRSMVKYFEQRMHMY
jgi:hypothetical protein